MIGWIVTIRGTPNEKLRKLMRVDVSSAVPQIFDHVYIALGARILWAVDLGVFPVIQANAVILHNIPKFFTNGHLS